MVYTVGGTGAACPKIKKDTLFDRGRLLGEALRQMGCFFIIKGTHALSSALRAVVRFLSIAYCFAIS